MRFLSVQLAGGLPKVLSRWLKVVGRIALWGVLLASPQTLVVQADPVPYSAIASHSAAASAPASAQTQVSESKASTIILTPQAHKVRALTVTRPATQHLSGPGLIYSGRPIDTTDLETFADTLIPALMQHDHVLGVSVAIVQGHTPLLIKGYGYDRLSPARPVVANRTLFRLGSVTKTFTWIVARQEVEAGRMSMDAPISTYLTPEILPEDRSFRPIRLRDLMDHSAGFEDSALGNLFFSDAGQIESIPHYLGRHRTKRVRDPGLFSSYSNFGAALAAMAAVQTSKARDVPTLMEARLFRPLGLDHTTLREPYDRTLAGPDLLPDPMPASLASDVSQGFFWDGTTFVPQPFEHAIALSGALSGSSTASDMAKYMSALLGDGEFDGVRIYGPASAPGFRMGMMHVPSGYNGWAQGFVMRRTPQGYNTVGHSGTSLWFSDNLVIVPELNLGIFVAANTQTGEALTETFPDLLLGHLKNDESPPPLTPAPDQAFAAQAQSDKAFEGHYMSSRRAYGGLKGAISRLINTVDVSFADDGRLILTAPDAAGAYIPTRAQGFFIPQMTGGAGLFADGLHFLTDANGRASAFESSANMARYERVNPLMTISVLDQVSVCVVIISVLSLVGLLRPGDSREHPTPEQTRAKWINYGIALLWIFAIATFNGWRTQVADDPSALFIDWPSGSVVMASLLALMASLGTLYQIGSLYWVLSDGGRYDDGWRDWQKACHVAILVFWTGYAILLMAWGALEPWSAWSN